MGLSSPLATRASRVALWALVGLGAGGGLLGATSSAPSSPSPAPATPASDAPAAVGGVAEIAVRRWLDTGGNASLSGDRGSIETGRDGKSRSRLEVLSTAAVASRRIDVGYWAVTVAADLRQSAAPALDAEMWFFEVGVLHGEDGTVAVGTPAVVPQESPPPSSPAGPALGLPRPGDPLAATAESFLRALLASSGEVGRYLAPGTPIPPVNPPPFAAVEVERTAPVETSPDRTILRVEALATTAHGTDLRLVYELTLEERGGRWEVRHLSGAPTLRHVNASPANRGTTTLPATKARPAPPTTSSPTPGA